MFYKDNHNREKQLRFSIRKVSFGAASVAVAALLMLQAQIEMKVYRLTLK